MDICAEEGRRYPSLAELHDALRSADSVAAMQVVADNALKSHRPEVAEHERVECTETSWCHWRTTTLKDYLRDVGAGPWLPPPLIVSVS